LPNHYCTSAGGHVQAGESYRDAAIRELKEEIGIGNSIEEVDYFMFTDQNDHRRLIKVFVTKAEDGFSFADGEVSEGAFFSLFEVKEILDKNKKVHPQLTACLNRLFGSNFFDFYNKGPFHTKTSTIMKLCR